MREDIRTFGCLAVGGATFESGDKVKVSLDDGSIIVGQLEVDAEYDCFRIYNDHFGETLEFFVSNVVDVEEVTV